MVGIFSVDLGDFINLRCKSSQCINVFLLWSVRACGGGKVGREWDCACFT